MRAGGLFVVSDQENHNSRDHIYGQRRPPSADSFCKVANIWQFSWHRKIWQKSRLYKEWKLNQLSQEIEANIGGLPRFWRTYLVRKWSIFRVFVAPKCGILTTYKRVPAGYLCAVTEKTIFHAIILTGSGEPHLLIHFAKLHTFEISCQQKLHNIDQAAQRVKQI